MSNLAGLIIPLAAFAIVALASRQIGDLLARFKLPLITGFLACGILAGPFVLGLLPADGMVRLRFLDEIALAYIAFAAGNELRLSELRSRFRSLAFVTTGLVICTFTLGTTALYLLSEFVPFMRGLPPWGRLAVALLGGTILVARSPSSAIAVIKEVRAKGPFTQTVLGVTVVMDVVVIVLFGFGSSVADAIFSGLGFDAGFLLLLTGDLAIALILGLLLGLVVRGLLWAPVPSRMKVAALLALGYGAFAISHALGGSSAAAFGLELHVEPLLVCMLGSFYVTNFTPYRAELRRELTDIGPAVFIVFFTLTGASLDLDVLATTWEIAVVLFAVRLVGIFIGSFTGGSLAGDPMRLNRVSWMGFVTQAGIGLGLARQAGVEFTECGVSFVTVMTAVIVINQIVGPPLFKWVLTLVGEALVKARPRDFDSPRDALIFGLEDRTIALARRLTEHGWNARIASRMARRIEGETIDDSDVDIRPIREISLEVMRDLGADRAEALVLALSDEENLEVAELAYEHFGIHDVVVRLHDRDNFEQFHELGALVVDPRTAEIGLLESFVRSPDAASIMMGMEADQDIIGVELRNVELVGRPIRDMGLPLDVHVLSVRRQSHLLISGGYTQLHRGDFVTLTGSLESLEQVKLLFDE